MDGARIMDEVPGRLSVKDALAQQDFAHLLGLAPCIVALFVVNGLDDTHLRPFLLYDGTISFPYNPDSSIPYWVAVLAPFLSLLLSFALGEWAAKRFLGFSPTAALANFLHFTIDALYALVVTALLTDVFKLLVGRYRPDWLMRCQPAVPATVEIVYGQPAALNAACSNTGLSPSKLRDGRHSFPSGHASTAFVLGGYLCVYCLWAAHYRYRRLPPRHSTWKRRLAADTLHTLVFYWILVQLSWTWGVAVSRVMDNKHHPSDIVAGALLGTSVALVFVARAIPRQPFPTAAPPEEQGLLQCSGQVTPPSPHRVVEVVPV